jgi:hypothetical protein
VGERMSDFIRIVNLSNATVILNTRHIVSVKETSNTVPGEFMFTLINMVDGTYYKTPMRIEEIERLILGVVYIEPEPTN